MKRKNIVLLLVSILVGGILLSGCQGNDEVESSIKVLKVGATPVPHAEILEIVKDDLKEQNIKLEVIEFTDYIKPNLALSDGEIDANFFQHVPYMTSFAQERKIDIASLGKVHVEPMALYSKNITDIKNLEDGSVIAIPNDPTNGGRALLLLQENDLITLDEKVGLEATEKDVVTNPKNLVFKPLEAAQLPRVLQDVDGAVINGNYAIEAGFNPSEDSLLIEDENSPYANIITIRSGEENDPNLKALLDALQSEEVKSFIEGNYEGGVIPVF